jgi:hypothetical protein
MQTILKRKKWKEYDYPSEPAVDVVHEATGGSLNILVNNAGIGKVWCFLRKNSIISFLPSYNQQSIISLNFLKGGII